MGSVPAGYYSVTVLKFNEGGIESPCCQYSAGPPFALRQELSPEPNMRPEPNRAVKRTRATKRLGVFGFCGVARGAYRHVTVKAPDAGDKTTPPVAGMFF